MTSKGRHDLPHAARRNRRQGISRHPQRRPQRVTDKPIRAGDLNVSPKRRANSSSRPSSRSGSTARARPLHDKYTVYRLGNNKGFRTIGFINQDLDLFRMPVELRIETDGKTVNQKIDVVGH